MQSTEEVEHLGFARGFGQRLGCPGGLGNGVGGDAESGR
jgi:hypothetical protein